METLAVLLIFSLELEISGVAVQRIHENSERWLSQNDVDAVLATFFCYDYGANASEALQKIATDQKDYPKSSSCIIVCCE